MAEIKLKDFVDEDSLAKLKELDSTIGLVREQYKSAVQELAKGLKIEVQGKGDLDSLTSVYKKEFKNVAGSAETLNDALRKQMELAEKIASRLEKKAENTRLSAKQAQELAKATSEVSKSIQQTARAEEAAAKARKAGASSLKESNMTEKERKKLIREAIELSDKEVHSIAEATQANKKLRQAVRVLRDTDKDYTDTLGRLNSTIGVNTDYMKRNSDRYTKQKMTIGSYREEIKGAWMELNKMNDSMQNLGILPGSFGQSFEKLGELSQMFSGSKGAGMLSMLKNPLVIGGTALGAAGAGLKWWVDYNKGLLEATRLTQQFTGKTGEALKMFRTDAQVLADFYNKDFKEMLIASNAMAKQFGIEADEALRLVKDGFISGADANGEFLDILREYPAYFKEAGISAETFIAITAQAAKSGIYSDKGVDAIKEGNIRIREMTKATAAALEGIGISADKVQEQLQNGQKTTFDIIQMVSEKLNELPESSSAVGTALADIFGGPGEDAGLQYIRTLKDIKTSLSEVKKESGELGKAQEDMMEAQKRLSKELALLFDATGGTFETLTAKIKATFNDMLAEILAGIRRAVESVDALSDRQEREARSDGKRYGEEEVSKQYALIDSARKKYVEQGMSEEDALQKAREERIQSLKRVLKVEEAELKKAVDINKKYYDEYQNSSIFMQMFTGEGKIKDSWADRMVAERSVSSIGQQISLVESYNPLGGGKNTNVPETEEEMKTRLKAEADLQDSRIALMEEGFEKEEAVIRNGYKKRMEAIEGSTEAERLLRMSLQEEMEDALAEHLEAYSIRKEDTNLKNRLALVEKNSTEELAVRLNMLELQKYEELKAAEKTGADVSLIEKKYMKQRQELCEEYAHSDVVTMAEAAADSQTLRTAAYNMDLKELEKSLAQKLIDQEEYEKQKTALSIRYAKESAEAAVSALENQLAVEDLSTEEREKLAKKLQTAKINLAEVTADAEIAGIKKVEDEDRKAFEKRMERMKKILETAGEVFNGITEFSSAIMEGNIQDIEAEQEANDEAGQRDIERIEQLEESGVITKEQAEARKRAAEERTAKRNEELEEKKKQIQVKQAKWQKANAIIQAGIATSLGIMQAMAMLPPNIPLAAYIGAMGAIQVATIAAQPIPKYAKGTKGSGHPGGLAVVGDGGREEVVLYGERAYLTPSRPTLVNLPKGTEVFPSLAKGIEELNSMNPELTDLSDLRKLLSGMEIPTPESRGPQYTTLHPLQMDAIERRFKSLENAYSRGARMQARAYTDASYKMEFERLKKEKL